MFIAIIMILPCPISMFVHAFIRKHKANRLMRQMERLSNLWIYFTYPSEKGSIENSGWKGG